MLALLAAAAFVASGAACVGDSPNTSPGTKGGACYPNGSCDVGLTCQAGICVPTRDGGGFDGGPDGSPEAAAADASSPLTVKPTPLGVQCGAALCSGQTPVCCTHGDASPTCGTSACPQEYDCDESYPDAGDYCCLGATAEGTCPLTLTLTRSYGSQGQAYCAPGLLQLCSSDAQCNDGGTCVQAVGLPFPAGICQ